MRFRAACAAHSISGAHLVRLVRSDVTSTDERACQRVQGIAHVHLRPPLNGSCSLLRIPESHKIILACFLASVATPSTSVGAIRAATVPGSVRASA